MPSRTLHRPSSSSPLSSLYLSSLLLTSTSSPYLRPPSPSLPLLQNSQMPRRIERTLCAVLGALLRACKVTNATVANCRLPSSHRHEWLSGAISRGGDDLSLRRIAPINAGATLPGRRQEGIARQGAEEDCQESQVSRRQVKSMFLPHLAQALVDSALYPSRRATGLSFLRLKYWFDLIREKRREARGKRSRQKDWTQSSRHWTLSSRHWTLSSLDCQWLTRFDFIVNRRIDWI